MYDTLDTRFQRNKLILFVHNGYPNETDFDNGIKKCYTPIIFNPAKIINPSRSNEMVTRTINGRLVKKDVAYTGIEKVEIEFYFSSISHYGSVPIPLNPNLYNGDVNIDSSDPSYEWTRSKVVSYKAKEGSKINYYVQLLQFAWYYQMPVYLLEPWAWWSNRSYQSTIDTEDTRNELYPLDRDEEPLFLAYRGVITEYPNDFFSNRKITGSPGRIGISVDGTVRSTRKAESTVGTAYGNNTQDWSSSNKIIRTASFKTSFGSILSYQELSNYDVQDYNWQAMYLQVNNGGNWK